MRCILFKVELAQPTQRVFFGLPHTVDHVLNAYDEVRLAVSSITEGHVWWIRLGDRRQCQVWRPGLNQNHVASNQACGIRTTPRVCLAVKDHRSVTIGGVSQDLMEMDRKAVEVTNVIGTEIRMKSIVE